jgi:hypothetical protein
MNESYGEEVSYNVSELDAPLILPTAILGGATLTAFLFDVGTLSIQLGFGPFGWASFIATLGFTFATLIYSNQIAYQNVYFSTKSWVHPVQDSYKCEKCNDLGDLCTEYKCTSLGEGICVYDDESGVCYEDNINDQVAPIIEPYSDVITSGYTYSEISGESLGGYGGYKIIQKNGRNYINASDPIKFGIITNEPARCKISTNPDTGYEGANLGYISGSSKLKYNFSIQMKVPNSQVYNDSGIELVNGDEMNFYVWCSDARENVNEQPYLIRFKVDPTPDESAPIIVGSSILDNRCVGNETIPISIYVKDVTYAKYCKWDREDKSYESMDSINIMNCVTSTIDPTYSSICTGNLNSVSGSGTVYYFTCEDIYNNSNSEQAYSLTLRTGSELKMESISPDNTTLYGSITEIPVTLEVQTLLGCNDGKATCYYTDNALSERYRSLIKFADTENEDGVSMTKLCLGDGDYEYFIKCTDEGGHTVNKTIDFSIEIDTESPIVARLYEDSGYLNIITAYDSECVYTSTNCDYNFEEGTVIPVNMTQSHKLVWDKTKTYYIKCRDEYREAPADCSTIVRPTSI